MEHQENRSCVSTATEEENPHSSTFWANFSRFISFVNLAIQKLLDYLRFLLFTCFRAYILVLILKVVEALISSLLNNELFYKYVENRAWFIIALLTIGIALMIERQISFSSNLWPRISSMLTIR
jgi:hypothetical protein